ncbi:winged helix-turn-helix domain-containing tetratricopeptide repeat protein [Falsiruegeria litorea]|uniref:winged helix-turn-helix domain-containing tetratricopeptide repeat protein n=1 Tax=Falsiruegeria litorea TaxID=1280831 RepID=UPI0013FE4237|nr:winged helix-turn-helix domain-containing protein [Falsiruegeria litorea]
MSADDVRVERISLGETIYVPEHDQLYQIGGAPVYLRAQSSKVLQYLAQRLGLLVTREELISHVWRGLAVTDDSLTQCISDLRRALGDKERKVLRTLPKRGFVLNGEVIPADQMTVEASVPVVQLDDLVQQRSPEVIASIVNWKGVQSPEFQSQAALVSSGSSQMSVKQIRFPSVPQAVATCRQWASKHGAIIALTLPGEPFDELLSATQSGEILVSVEVRELAQHHPVLSFEDLGHFNEQSLSRAFRLAPDGSDLVIEPDFKGQPLLPAVAVLPLQNIQGNEPDVLGTVFADLVSGTLSAAEEINVISRLSTAAFSRGKPNMADVGRFLKAEFVLSGFFIRRDDRMQLNLEFAEVLSRRMLWSYRLDVSISDLLGEFEAAYEIVAKIRRAILINEIRRASIKPLGDLQNYSLMLAAVGLMHRLSPHEFSKARKLLDVLADRAPNHPAPLAWTARWHLLRVVQGWSDDPAKDAQAALGCTGRALDADPENVLALACEGHVLTNLTHRFDEAEDRYNLALENNPSDPNARALRGMLLAFQDRGEEGVRDTELALRLSPLDPHRFFYLAMAAGAWFTPGDFEKAEQYAKASLRLNRTHLSTLRMLAVAQQKSGKHQAARGTVAELMRLQPGLRVNSWLKSSPSADFRTGRLFAQALREAGVPD